MKSLSIKSLFLSGCFCLLLSGNVNAGYFDCDSCLGFDHFLGKYGSDDCCVDSCVDYAPEWVVSSSAVAMTRTNSASQALLIGGGGATVLNADAFKFDYKMGYDIALRREGCDHFVEFRFLGIDSLQSRVNGPSGSALVTNPPTFFGAGIVNAEYGTNLYSGEVNIGTYTCGDGEIFVGYRQLQINEEMAMNFDGGTGFFGSDTNNNLYGFQLGGRKMLQNNGPFSLEGTGKFGIYANTASSNVEVRSPTSTPPFATAASRGDNVSISLEVGLKGRYQINNTLSLIAGYQAMYLTGIAMAPDQFASTAQLFPGPPVVPTSVDYSSTIYHGGFVGLEMTF